MAQREVKIRLSADDVGATSTINRLSKAMADLGSQGKDTKVLFSAEFHDAQVSRRVEEITARMQAAADKHHIAIEAQLIEKEANRKLFGDQAKKPLRTISRNADEQAWRDSQADVLRARRQSRLEAELFGGGGVGRAAGAGRDLGKAVGEEAGDAAGKGFFESLKKFSGGRGPLKDIGELLVGGGAVAGATFLAKAVGEAADHAEELRKAYAKGKITASEFAGDVLRSLPVLGQFTQAFDSLGKLGRGLIGYQSENDKKEEADKKLDERRADALVREKAIADQVKKQNEMRLSLREIDTQNTETNSKRGLSGSAAELVDAQNEKARIYAEAAKLEERAQAEKVGSELLLKAQESANQMRLAADADYLEKSIQIDKDHKRELSELNRAHGLEIAKSNSEIKQRDLELQKKHLAAQIEAYRDAYRQELADLDAKRKAELKDLSIDDPRFAAAQGRYNEAAAASERRRDQNIAGATKEEQDAIAKRNAGTVQSIGEQARAANRVRIETERIANGDLRTDTALIRSRLNDRLSQIDTETAQAIKEAPLQQNRLLAESMAQKLGAEADAVGEEFAARTRERQKLSTLSLASGADVFGSGRVDLMREQTKADVGKAQQQDAKRTAENTQKIIDKIAELINVVRNGGGEVLVLK